MTMKANQSWVHWNYFIALEQDLTQVSRYIEFSENNFKTYSVELAHILLAASSEVDVIMQLLCNALEPEKRHDKICAYADTCRVFIPDFAKEECYVDRYGMRLQPWINWDGESPRRPCWWRAYNKVKHERNAYYHQANLKNALDSVAALALVCLYYYRQHFSGQDLVSLSETRLKLTPSPTLIDFNEAYRPGFLLL